MNEGRPEKETQACEKAHDEWQLNKVENLLIELIRGTTNALAIDELTKALAHTRHSRRALERFGVNFYKGGT